MKKISDHLGQIIVSLACVAVLISVIVLFRAPIGNFFNDIIDKETALGSDILGGLGGNSSNKKLSLPGELPAGTYSLRYENSGTVLTDYADICSLEITGSGEGATYDKFIPQNTAPVEATAIGVYNASNERVAEIELGSLSPSGLGNKLYSFAAFSDSHVGANTGAEDLQRALEYVQNDNEIDFTTICGDLTLNGSTTNLASYKSIVDTYTTKPVYAVGGNHEIATLLDQGSLQAYTGKSPNFTFNVGDDVFIMLSVYDKYSGNPFTAEQLQWLYETLEANRNKRCFLFMHYYPGNGSGDAINMDNDDRLNNTYGEVFYSLISHYKNVTWFHGHSHEEFALQEVNKMNNYDKKFGVHSVHVPSLAYPKRISGSSLAANYAGSEGYVVDVYQNCIVLKGRDFVSGKFLPIASYSLKTPSRTIPADTYQDSTGTITNSNSAVLKSGSSWYDGSVDKSTITKISLVTNYLGTAHDESWDASVSGNDTVMVYRTGTELVIDGNESGIIANKDSNMMFSGFSNLKEINGLETLNTSNVQNAQSMFSNCSNLQSLNLSAFDDATLTNVQDMFNGCSSLTELNVSYLTANTNKFNGIFKNCSSLETLTLGKLGNGANLYLNDAFAGCSSLTEIDMGVFNGALVNLSSTFSGCSALSDLDFSEANCSKITSLVKFVEGCSALERLDISNFNVANCENMSQAFSGCSALTSLTLPDVFDTGKVTTMLKMFENCSSLTLDCSGWDTTSCTSVGAFNNNAPGVIPPSLN